MASHTEPSYFQEARREGREIVTETPKFELESYISNYKGKAKIDRLVHIGRTSTFLYHEALALAIAEAKDGKDVEMYEHVVSVLEKIDPEDPLAAPDKAWIMRTSNEVKAETTRLEVELKGYRNNLIKESIRMGFDDAGRHYQDIGNTKEAEKAFLRERDYCQTPTHVAIMTFRLVRLFLERKAWMTVESNALKLRDIVQSNSDSAAQIGIVSAIVGLAQLSMGEYKRAAITFLDTNLSFLQVKPGNSNAEDPAGLRGVITPNDVATYGAFCALASMNRTELQARVLENTNFRQFLELEPHLRRAISFFIGGKFSQCLITLQSYRADYLLDVNLYPHFSELFARIRSKAIVQYFIPFSRVTFKALSEAFNTNENTVQSSLVELIQSGQLDGRLDLENGLLIANTTNLRSQVHQEALEAARNFERTMHQRILRMEAVASGLEVRAVKQKGTADGASGDILMGAEGNRSRAWRQR